MAKLYFYYAAMNAGKSTTLLQADYQLSRARHGDDAVDRGARRPRGRGHDRVAHRAVRAGRDLFAPTSTCSTRSSQELLKRKLDCMLVDEAQFLTRDHVLQLCRIADELGIPVLCYGLRTDFRASSFPARRRCSRWPTR